MKWIKLEFNQKNETLQPTTDPRMWKQIVKSTQPHGEQITWYLVMSDTPSTRNGKKGFVITWSPRDLLGREEDEVFEEMKKVCTFFEKNGYWPDEENRSYEI